MDEQFVISFPPEFPIDDVITIGDRLERSGALIPGYTPPPVGLLNLAALVYGEKINRENLTILPDRNITSRLAKIAATSIINIRDFPTQIAIDLMAFSQAMNINIEPSIAFHELAHPNGNQIAHQELAWFRVADQNAVEKWIDLALGRATNVSLGSPPPPQNEDLALPLRRWNRNYVATLKIGELALSNLTSRDRMLNLLDWMIDDFLFAGPAAIFAARYFAPSGLRKGLIKQLHSFDTEKAIKGIKNAAWDITHLSDFVRRADEGDTQSHRYIFATADRLPAEIAHMLIARAESQETMQIALEEYWPEADAKVIAERLWISIEQIRSGNRPIRSGSIDQYILDGEGHFRSLARHHHKK